MNDTALLHVLALQKSTGIGDITAKKLIRCCGSPSALLKAKHSTLLKIDGIGPQVLRALPGKDELRDAEKELAFIRKQGIGYSYFEDPGYPERLKHCIDGPILLFQIGNMNFRKDRVISVVGTRQITPYGLEACKTLIEELAPYDPIIVSGFAYGADITAHRAAIQHNLQTIACLAHGLNTMYPKSHRRYVEQVVQHGGFLSDFHSTDAFDRKNFLKRNRIIAGLSEATVIIESSKKGGSLNTATMAISYNREVFAVPGRITDARSEGCNNLIKFQKAHALTNAADIPYILNWQLEQPSQTVQKKLFVKLERDEQLVLDHLKENGAELLDLIALKCQMPVYRVASILLSLELKGVVRPLPGKLFEAI